MASRTPPVLNTVVVNTTVHESAALLELLRVWATTACAPLAPGDAPFRLVVLLNQEPGEPIRRMVLDAAERGALSAAISEVEFVVLALAPELDRYERHQVGDPGPYGFKSGPNVQFFRGLDRLEAAASQGEGFALVLETDTRPVRKAWVSAARAEVAAHPESWVLGSVYRGPEHALPVSIRSHLNGNAIYSLGTDFGEFRRTRWERALRELARTHPGVAYDFALDLALHTDAVPSLTAAIAAERHRFSRTDFIQNLVVWQRYDPTAVAWPAVVAKLLDENPGTYLIHGVRGVRRSPWD